MHRLFPLLLTVLLLVAAPASAESDRDTRSQKLTKRLLTARRIGEPGNTRPASLDPIRSVHAIAFPVPALGLFAQGTGFTLTRRSSLYDLEGGASLRLDEGIHLTASYRMLGVDLGFDADVEGADMEPGIQAPFLGLAFDF